MADKKTEQIVITLSVRELAEIDDYRFDNRISSRSEAVRQLIAAGLEHLKNKKNHKI